MTQQQENVMKLLRDLTLVDDEHLDVIEPEFEGDVVTINSVIENEFLDVGCRMTVSADGDVLCVDPDGQEARVSYREVPRAFIGYALSEGIEAAKEFTVQMDDGELPAFLSMLLTPTPDPMSMMMMMAPLLALYELGILLCVYTATKEAAAEV